MDCFINNLYFDFKEIIKMIVLSDILINELLLV
jgi:hypothetical protein